MKLIKLTDENDRSHGDTQWGKGVTHTASGQGNLCNYGWIHAYEDLLVGLMLNPVHANFRRPHAWKSEGSGEVKRDHGLKIGVTTLTTLRRIAVPVITTEQRVRFAILCAAEVYLDSAWRRWAQKWLDGFGRTGGTRALTASLYLDEPSVAASKAKEAALSALMAARAWIEGEPAATATAAARAARLAAEDAATAAARAARAARLAAEDVAEAAADAAAEATEARAAARVAAVDEQRTNPLDLPALARLAVSKKRIVLAKMPRTRNSLRRLDRDTVTSARSRSRSKGDAGRGAPVGPCPRARGRNRGTRKPGARRESRGRTC